MGDFIFKVTMIFQMGIFILMLYYLGISLFGLYRKDRGLKYAPEKKFALIVAAHNEEVVIGKIIESFLKMDYPRHLFDIFVIADNCTDDTAEVVRKYEDARVFERFDKNKRGKGYALQWMFDIMFKMDTHYDAVSIFDADNVVSANFLSEMNNKMIEGYKVVQGYLDSKNPHDTWISESYSIAFWSANRLFQLARNNLGLSNQIGGTGFCIDTSVLREIGWEATCLTEDLEFTCKLILNNQKVGWAHDAIVYDEKPLTLQQSWNQRKRWMQGFADVSSRFFLKLIKKAIVEKDIVAFDCALYTIQPFFILAFALSGILTFMQNSAEQGLNIFVVNYLFTVFTWKVFSVFQFIFTPVVMVIEKKLSKTMLLFIGLYSMNVFLFDLFLPDKVKMYQIILLNSLYLIGFLCLVYMIKGMGALKIFARYLLYGLYTLTWVPITIQGIIDRNKKEWYHTKHVRKIGINEV